MRYLYGPVQSRRLGLSLGITLTPHKVCSFDCIYCQLGKTTAKLKERKSELDINDILAELEEFLKSPDFSAHPPDYISLSGFGEPTLHLRIAQLALEIRKLTPIPLTLITNASLFSEASVRRDCIGVDVIIPSLDAVTQDIFERIDRPHPEIKIGEVIEGLIALRKEFKGKIYLEIMLIKDINDSIAYAHTFKEVIEKINPDKIQLNTPARSTAESWVEAADKERLLQVKEILGPKCEVI